MKIIRRLLFKRIGVLAAVLSFYLILLCGFSCEAASGLVLDQQPYKFDAGGRASELASDAFRLTPTDKYDSDSGYGWIESPTDTFRRKELARSRNDFTIDGVSGQRLVFRADVPAAEWWLTLWSEAGTEDSSTVTLEIGGKRRDLNWHPFLPTAEPRQALQKTYRIFHGPAVVEDQGLLFALKGGSDLIRLLGFTLTPDSRTTTPAQEDLLQRMRELGRYGSDTSLQHILTELEDMKRRQPKDAFAVYWSEQVQLLADVEEHFEKRGWEWAKQESGLTIFDRFHQAVMILDGLLNRPDVDDYPFYERALWYRGRLLYWLGKERGGGNEIAGGYRDLGILFKRYPDDKVLAMYNGLKIDLTDPCDELRATPGAPAWSAAQRELLCRLRQIAHWWVNERQAPNGEFGGKIDDDVELLRWWTPLILAGDTLTFEGWRKLADGVWQSPLVSNGYSKYPRDVEHSAEFIADTAPAMALYSDESKYLERLRYSLEYFDDIWTGKSKNGHRFFRSGWFSSTTVDTRPPRNRDLEYNSRAVKAVRYLAWKTRNPAVIKSLHEWSRAWVNAAMRTDKGKPAGIIPASVRFPDEAMNGDEPTWYIANMFWDYYDWSHHGGSLMLDQLLFTYTMTRDEMLLQPLFAALDLVSAHEENTVSEGGSKYKPGSPAWTADILKDNIRFWSVVGQWRLLMHDDQYDELILRFGTPYIQYRLTAEERHLVEGLENVLEVVRYNTPLRTSEVLHTDRVYAPGSEHLKAMLTGDGMPESMSPYFAVSWEGTDENFTALVRDGGPDRLSVQIFSHSETERTIKMRLWQLMNGNYKVARRQGKERIEEETVAVKEHGQRFSLLLPARKLLMVEFSRK